MARNYLENKSTVQVSGNTVQRFRQPTNPFMASNMTQFIFDYKKQQSHIPDRMKKVLVEATQNYYSGANKMAINQKTNRSATPEILGKADLGGTPDEPGRF